MGKLAELKEVKTKAYMQLAAFMFEKQQKKNLMFASPQKLMSPGKPESPDKEISEDLLQSSDSNSLDELKLNDHPYISQPFELKWAVKKL